MLYQRTRKTEILFYLKVGQFFILSWPGGSLGVAVGDLIFTVQEETTVLSTHDMSYVDILKF